MGWIVVSVLALVAALVGLAIAAITQDDDRLAGLALFFVAGVVGLFFTGLFAIHRVPNGHVGLVYTFGKITSQRGDGAGGLVLTLPWQTIDAANVQVQSMCPNGRPPEGEAKTCKEAYGTFSSESIDVFVNAKLNFHVDPEHIQTLYRTVGPDYESKIIQPRVSQVVKEETVKYSAVDIAPHREDIRKAVNARLVDELAARSIKADDFLLTNVDFNAEVKKSIDQKVIQAQGAAAAQAKVEQSRAEAEQARQVAQGQADANAILTRSLTPELIQYQAIQKLAGNIQIALIPSGQGLLLDPSVLLKPLGAAR